MLDPTLTQNQSYAYVFCTLSRLCHASACVVQKRALLKQAAFERYKTFKLSSFRKLKINDLNEDGEISKPIVAEHSALYNKAKYIINERKLIEKEQQSLSSNINNMQLFARQIQKDKIALNKFLQDQELVDKVKIDRTRGVTLRSGKVLMEKQKHRFQNRVQNQEINDLDRVKVLNRKKSSLSEDQDRMSENVADQIEDLDRQQNEKRIWAINMSEEMQELNKDYKFYQLHEHLFDGSDDIWLSKLDELFDSCALDGELFGIEVPSHFQLITVVGGLLSVPLFMIMHLISGDSMTSFMGILEPRYNSNFDFYNEMFSGKWQSVVIIIFLCIMYTLKPITTTNFVLSIQSSITYLAVELISKVFFIFITMILIESNAQISAMEALGLSLSLLSQIMYYNFSDKFKDQISVKSACEAIKQIFDYDSIQEIEVFEQKLEYIASNFSYVDAYRLLYDVALARDKRQIHYPTISTCQVQKLFDKNHYNNTVFWGNGYPRPSYEMVLQSHIANSADNIDEIKDQIVKVEGELIYDLKSIKSARSKWANMDNRDAQNRENSPQINESVMSENALMQTHQQLIDASERESSQSIEDNEDHSDDNEDAKSEGFMEQDDYDSFNYKKMKKELDEKQNPSPQDQFNQDQTIDQADQVDIRLQKIELAHQASMPQESRNQALSFLDSSPQSQPEQNQEFNQELLRFKKRNKNKKFNKTLQNEKNNTKINKSKVNAGEVQKKNKTGFQIKLKEIDPKPLQNQETQSQMIKIQIKEQVGLPELQSQRRASVWVEDFDVHEQQDEVLEFNKIKE